MLADLASIRGGRPAPAYFDNDVIARHLDYGRLIDDLARAFRSEIAAPIRSVVRGCGEVELLVMPALGRDHAGVKILMLQPRDGSDLPTIGGVYALFDVRTGTMLATMDAGELTARRTAAVSALASQRLSRTNAESLLLIGSGHLIPYLAEAHATVRRLRTVRIWARNPDKAKVSADMIAKRLPNCTVEVAYDLRTALGASDIVSAATRATEPLVEGDLLRPGTHLDLVGGYRPDMREVDDAGVRRSRIFVDDLDAAMAEAGDLLSPIERGVISRSDLAGDLAALADGAGRRTEEEITLFKSVGTAVSDLAAAELLWRSLNG